jgi:Apea-like HEPN
LSAEGHNVKTLIESLPDEFGGRPPLLPNRLLRWVIVSLSLCRTFQIWLPQGSYSFNIDDSGKLIPSGLVATHEGHDRSIFTTVPHHRGVSGPIELDELNKIATIIEPYYRPFVWRHDPVSVALSCFWAFLFSRFPDQAYISLITILETLLSTGTDEIAHQIAERAAVLLGDNAGGRLEIYQKIKKLYRLRSRIAHGDLELKKGVIN